MVGSIQIVGIVLGWSCGPLIACLGLEVAVRLMRGNLRQGICMGASTKFRQQTLLICKILVSQGLLLLVFACPHRVWPRVHGFFGDTEVSTHLLLRLRNLAGSFNGRAHIHRSEHREPLILLA